MKKLLFLACCCPGAVAQVPRAEAERKATFAKIFTDNMVVQQNQLISFWGYGTPGKSVEVEFLGKRWRGVVRSFGRWDTSFPPRRADNKPHDVVLRQGRKIVATLKNVVLGEVWIVSGESNMSRPVNDDQRRTANYPNIRFFNSSGVTPREHDVDWPTGWTVCSPEGIKTVGDHWRDPKDPKRVTIRAFSQVGFVFGRTIHEALGVPVGLIQASSGGSRAKDWTPVEGIQKKFPFDQPVTPVSHKPGLLYHIRVRPLRWVQVRGVVWYQGEDDGRNLDYRYDLKRLIEGWRELRIDLPFYMAQIAATSYASGMLGVYEAQQWVMDHVEQTGIAPSNDVYQQHLDALAAKSKTITRADALAQHQGHVAALTRRTVGIDTETGWPLHGMSNPNPPNKELIATRLARIALRETYQKEMGPVYGPMYRNSWIDGARIVVKFKHAGDGLRSIDGEPLNWFEIAENKRRKTKGKRGTRYAFVKAKAEITGRDTIAVHAEGVSKPRFVRFGWHMYARHNLVNSAGLPALPFRTERTADPRQR